MSWGSKINSKGRADRWLIAETHLCWKWPLGKQVEPLSSGKLSNDAFYIW